MLIASEESSTSKILEEGDCLFPSDLVTGAIGRAIVARSTLVFFGVGSSSFDSFYFHFDFFVAEATEFVIGDLEKHFNQVCPDLPHLRNAEAFLHSSRTASGIPFNSVSLSLKED